MEKMNFSIPLGFEVEIVDGDATDPTRQEAEWYRFGQGTQVVMKVRKGDLVATIEANGDMDIRKGDNHARYSDQLPDVGINNDKELMAAYERDGKDIQIVNNPWFEVWIGDWFSEPIYELAEAIDTAANMLVEEELIRSAGNGDD